MKLANFLKALGKSSNKKIHENPSSGRRVAHCRQTIQKIGRIRRSQQSRLAILRTRIKSMHNILDSRYKARVLCTLLWILHFTVLQHAPCKDYNKSSWQLQTMTESPVITNYTTVCAFLLVPPIRHNCVSASVTQSTQMVITVILDSNWLSGLGTTYPSRSNEFRVNIPYSTPTSTVTISSIYTAHTYKNYTL